MWFKARICVDDLLPDRTLYGGFHLRFGAGIESVTS
jgi:hypothetical protein